MDVKIDCLCGTRYGFDVEPENGRMPTEVACPGCGTDGTQAANVIIQSRLATSGSTRPVRVTVPIHNAHPAHPPVAAPPSPAQTAPPAPIVPEDQSLAIGTTPHLPRHDWAEPLHLLDHAQFFVKERVGLLKLTDTYDILDPATRQLIGLVKEEPPTWAKALRLLLSPQMLPTAINVYEKEGAIPVVSMTRGLTFFRAKVRVRSAGRDLGYFRTKWFSLRGGFRVHDPQDHLVAELKGNWVGWEFRFLSNSGREIGTVTKKWAGLGKELFTSADNYLISITDTHGVGAGTPALLLAAGLAVDTLFKEKGGGAGLSGVAGGD